MIIKNALEDLSSRIVKAHEEFNNNSLKVEDLYTYEQLYPIVEKEAKSKNLNVYHFKDDELWKGKDLDIEILTIAKTRDNAKWNVTRQKHCYLIKKQ